MTKLWINEIRQTTPQFNIRLLKNKQISINCQKKTEGGWVEIPTKNEREIWCDL